MSTIYGWAASSESSSIYAASKAFDYSAGTRWSASDATFPQWLSADLGSAEVSQSYEITPGDFSAASNPKDWTYEGSNDGTSWTVLDTRTAQTFATQSTLRTFTFANSTAYRYYRINVTATSGAAAASVSAFRPRAAAAASRLFDFMPIVNGGPDTYNLGVVFKPLATGSITHLRFYEMAANTGTITLKLYGAAAAVLATATYTATGTAGWREVAITPVAVTAGTEYLVARHAAGAFCTVQVTLNSNDIVSSDVMAPRYGGVTYNGSTENARYGAGTGIPTASAGGAYVYAVSVTFAPTVTNASPSATATASASPASLTFGTFDLTSPTAAVAAAAASGALVVTNPNALTSPTATVAAAAGPDGLAGVEQDGRAVTALTHTPVGVLPVIPLLPSTDLAHAVPVMRKSVLAPVLSAEYPAHPAPGSEGAPATVEGVVGYVHLWVSGQDVTYWRGGMTVIKRWESEAPFGDTVAAFSFPQKNPWDVDGEGDLAFLRPDAPVAIGLVVETVVGGTTVRRTRRLWSGFLDAQGSGLDDGEFYDYEAKGTLWQAQSRIREPLPITAPVDIGVQVARVLNASEGRRWRAMPLTPIGITTLTRGSRDEFDMEYVQALLSEALTDDLRQWTLTEPAPGLLTMALKPAPSTVHATVAYGTPGVDIALRVDQSTRMDRVFMRGIGPKMGGWANVFYPGLELLNAPAYPMAGLANIVLGTTDADTTSGTGVTDWQRRVAEIRGFANPPVSGVMSSAWVAVVDDLQRILHVTVDGSLGPQTWNATFDRGVAGVNLDPVRLPLASKPQANAYLYGAAGSTLGPNPDFDTSMIVRDVAIDAGPGKTKAQGRALARKILAQYGTAAANGQIVFTFDPNETDRTTLSHLSNVKVTGYQGTDRVVQVASKSVELEAGDDGPVYVVTTRVDERARDATAVEDLLEQRRNAIPDISRNPSTRNKASRQVSDQRTPWDSESPCGVLRRTAVNGDSGLWSVVTIPFAEVGKLSGIRLTSTQPFALAIFASLRITENKLAAIVGDPFASSDPWRDTKGVLDEYGIIEAWGEQGNACGYSPKTETDDGAAFTGDFILDTPLDYWTETIPYVSVAIYMRGGSGWISGEFLPAYEA